VWGELVEVDGFPFSFSFFLFSVWCGWMARRPDMLLASDVRALVVLFCL
jgi:hypothetical protein